MLTWTPASRANARKDRPLPAMAAPSPARKSARALETATAAVERGELPPLQRVGLVYALKTASEAVARAAGVARRFSA